MDSNFSLWTTHCWIGRRLELVLGQPLDNWVCHECARAFVDECSTGERYAVHVAIFGFNRLSDEVTSRWLSEKCPAEWLKADEADRQTRFPLNVTAGVLPLSSIATTRVLAFTAANALDVVWSRQHPKNGILRQNALPQLKKF